MFDPNADAAINYGAIGGVIGHELTHGFDDQGRKFDADGKLHDWWTAEDAKTFEARAAVLGAQYSKFEPLPGAKVNGDLTMGENIADLGGLTIALDAYRASLKGEARAGPRWTHGRAARLSRLGASLARQGARRFRAQTSRERSAFAAPISCQRRGAKHRFVCTTHLT